MAILFSILQLIWAYVWAALHLRIRKQRRYAQDRIAVDSNHRYRLLSPLMYLLGNILPLLSFWIDRPWLLSFHRNELLRSLGFFILYSATALYVWSLKHLGENYSPCFDAHLPKTLIASGPYTYIRHPMYLAKIAVGVGGLIVCGSWWLVISTVYLVLDTLRSVLREESYLQELTDFEQYKRRSKMLLPFVF